MCHTAVSCNSHKCYLILVDIFKEIERYLSYTLQQSEVDDILVFCQMHAAEFKDLLVACCS